MTDEVQEAVNAPEQTETATAAPETVAPETTTEEVAETKPAKTFSQEEVDALIGKRLAREQRKWEREQKSKAVEPIAQTTAEPLEQQLPVGQDIIQQKAEELIQQREVQKQKAEIEDAYAEREEDAREKYEDFEQVAYNPRLRITDAMAETIKSSEIGPDLAYWLGSNPKEADRISRLSPLQQAREIGKIEIKLASDPPVKKTTSAPAPITPVTSRGSTPTYDTTDPRSLKTMSTSEWIEAERQRQIKKAQANR